MKVTLTTEEIAQAIVFLLEDKGYKIPDTYEVEFNWAKKNLTARIELASED